MPDPISWSHAAPYLIAAFFGSYLLGSVPFGLVITRLFGLGDIRKIGSGNIGATNVLRTGRKGLALATLICDSGKGALAVLLAALWGPDLALIAALGSVLGHLFPVWLKFKGGKGVATTLGVVLALSWQVGLVACLTWLVTALLFRISSLAALLAMLATPIAVWFLHGDLQMVELTALLALIVWARHHQNISRLLKGQEPRIGKK
ncbi:glycerol-3-phosphate 1-O-acyltransferase PlsY [Kiloniella laminariae]|uniref:Glycerol-3-phosphate acyltransferase n=1 Tax=Kiloniella laminariae TaxID=454162 RepID=A0ABT4LK27_9PROT|nr:glycerol-3-phosphate 1-O-acyltransferase PlsY [Kiloniella laminariae]MCZ4280347.1 glycerol-3-phosphate 1-O-acyltransferase PlsY [Kiloniella laminariae]